MVIIDNNFEHDHEKNIHENKLEGEENKDERILQILLEHWVEHNKSHEETFIEWAEKAKALGKIETSQCLKKAIEYMIMADKMLIDARNSL